MSGVLTPLGKLLSTSSLTMHPRPAVAKRLLSTSSVRHATRLVGPLHPVSHLRPVVYGGTRIPASSAESKDPHPYSLAEFRDGSMNSAEALKRGLENPTSDAQWQLNWKLMDNDAKEHAFWVEVRIRTSGSV